MFTIVQSSVFTEWLSELADRKGKARILARLTGAEHGNFCDCAPIGEGVSEMRFHFGPGYRIDFVRNGATVYVLLNGGDKGSQRRLERTKAMARELTEQDG